MIYLLLSLCFATPRLSYEKELEAKVMVRVLTQIEQQNHREVQNIIDAFEKELFPSEQLCYDVGLAYNQQGNLAQAKKYYNRAIEINPNQASALYDRAELYLLEGKTAEAKTDLERLINQKQQHWAIYFRLAEIAAKEQDGKKMEEYLLQAIRYDMDITLLLKDPLTWKKVAKDPKLEPYLHRIFVIMAEEKLWEMLISGQ